MKIALLNEKITVQKQTATADSIGNHINAWTDYFTCYATISGEESSVSGENAVAGQTVSDSKIAFTIRWCVTASVINSTEYRVLFRNELYNITGIDHMNFKKKSIKLMCVKVRR